MTSSKDYWAAREKAQQEANKKLDAKFDKELKKIYDAALINIRQEIDAFYGRYATKEGISLAEAKKRVSQADIKAYEAKAKEYVANRTFTKQANEEMRLYNLTMKVNRLEMLKSRIGMELAAKYSDMERKAAKHLQSGAEDEFKRMAGILGKSVPDVKKAASTIPGASFHNATYSERIWTNQRALKSEIDKLLQEGMIQGRNPRAIAPQLQRAFGVSKVASERLMRTEMCRVQIEAQRQSYDENGIDEFEYMAHAGCCEICAGMNGKVFKVNKMIVGDNAPPMHPNCRCGTVPHMDREAYEEWLNDDNMAELIDKSGYYQLGAGKRNSKSNTTREELGYIDPSKIKAAKKYYGDLIRDEKIEHSFVIQKDGKVIHFTGDESGVSPYDVDFRGAVVIHNHPESNGIVSFGEDDFIFLRNNQNIAELVATNKVYTYSTRVLQSISEIPYNEIYRNSFEFLYTDDFEPQHGAFLFLSKKGYVEYERKRIDKTPRKKN